MVNLNVPIEFMNTAAYLCDTPCLSCKVFGFGEIICDLEVVKNGARFDLGERRRKKNDKVQPIVSFSTSL